MNTEIKKCEGSCEEDEGHVGEVVFVEVSGGGWKAMHFWYCQAAIAEDQRRGFNVEVLKEIPSQQTDKQ
jgi:hypothetical protein